MSNNKKVKITCNNLDSNTDIDSFFREIDKCFRSDNDISNINTGGKFNISVEVVDENTAPKNLNFKNYIKWIKR